MHTYNDNNEFEINTNFLSIHKYTIYFDKYNNVYLTKPNP